MTPTRRLLHYFRRYRRPLTAGALCVVGSAAFKLMQPLIIGGAVNELVTAVSRGTLIRFALLLVGAAAVEGIFLYLQRSIIIGTSRRIEYDMRNDLYVHLQRLPLSYYQDQRTGDLMSRATNDLSSVRMLIGPAVMHAFSSLLVVAGAFVMMLRIELGMALISLMAVPIVAGMVSYFGAKIHVHFRSVQDYFGDISARVQENLSGVRVVRAFAQEFNEVETFKRMNREYVERNRSLIRLTALFYPALHAVIGLMFVLIFFLGTRRIISGELTIGSFVAFQFYLGRMIWPLIALGWVINLFQRGMASMQRLHEVWSVPANVQADRPAAGGLTPAKLRGDLDIRNLTFSYDGRAVLRDLNLSVPHGQTVGIVGPTGSGKTTLLNLITRTFEPPPVSIFLDGIPIEAFPVRELRELIGMVPQESFLFSESIAENIRFGKAEAKDEEIGHSAELAGLSGDVSAFPQGLQTMIGERGITLSGGQKQRTAIARALVREPVILILDDSLSAVDTATEERILNSLRQVREGRTVLIVSHRVSSVKDADHIVVLEEGAMVEQGSHDELISKDGYYANLYRRQTIEAELEEIA